MNTYLSLFTLFLYSACAQDKGTFINYTDNGCIYYRSHQGDSLIALARHDTTLILLKRKLKTDTILCRDERMEIKDIQVYENKCIIVYVANFALNYLAMMKSQRWFIAYAGGGHEIPGTGVGVMAKPHEIKNNPSVRSIQLYAPTLKIISENELLQSDRFGKRSHIEIDYLNKKSWKVRHFPADSSNFFISESGMETVVLSTGSDGRDTVWANRETNLDYTIDTIIHKGNILGFVSLNSIGKYTNRKLSYTFRSFQWNGKMWIPLLEKSVGLYGAYSAEVEEVKHIAYNQVRVTKNSGQGTLIEYDLVAKTEKRTEIK